MGASGFNILDGTPSLKSDQLPRPFETLSKHGV